MGDNFRVLLEFGGFWVSPMVFLGIVFFFSSLLLLVIFLDVPCLVEQLGHATILTLLHKAFSQCTEISAAEIHDERPVLRVISWRLMEISIDFMVSLEHVMVGVPRNG